MLSKLILPTLPGFQDNYYARDNYESSLHKIDSKVTWTPGNKLNLNNRLSWLTSRQNSHGIFPSVDGAEYNPLSVGRLWQAKITSGSVLATSIISPTIVVDGVFGYTPYHSWVEPEGPADECWGAHFSILNACQPPRSRDRAAPGFNMGGWALVTPSQIRDYADNQVQWSGNIGWTKGTHNVKAGFDINRMYREPLRDGRADVHVQRRRHGAQRRHVSRTCSTSSRTSCSACRSRALRRR